MRPLANKKRAHLSLSHALWKLSACVPGLLLQAVPRHKVRSLCRLDQGVLVFLRERHTDIVIEEDVLEKNVTIAIDFY